MSLLPRHLLRVRLIIDSIGVEENMKESTKSLIYSLVCVAAFVLEAVGAARYASRDSVDWVGAGLLMAAALAFAIAAAGFYLGWVRRKRDETPPGGA